MLALAMLLTLSSIKFSFLSAFESMLERGLFDIFVGLVDREGTCDVFVDVAPLRATTAFAKRS
jgi:hypothetical protein